MQWYKSYRHKGIRVIGIRVVVLVSNIHPVDSSQERGAERFVQIVSASSDVCRNVKRDDRSVTSAGYMSPYQRMG